MIKLVTTKFSSFIPASSRNNVSVVAVHSGEGFDNDDDNHSRPRRFLLHQVQQLTLTKVTKVLVKIFPAVQCFRPMPLNSVFIPAHFLVYYHCSPMSNFSIVEKAWPMDFIWIQCINFDSAFVHRQITSYVLLSLKMPDIQLHQSYLIGVQNQSMNRPSYHPRCCRTPIRSSTFSSRRYFQESLH
jgi:hypothetical protein